jgi:hypothetical protein
VTGQTCYAGRCTGSGGAGADGCSGLAHSISITQIAVYQSIKIPIADGQSEVAAENRVAQVVTGRETMFRVFVRRESGWVDRELSARVTIWNPNQDPVQHFQKKSITGDSVDATSTTTFQVSVPAAQIQLDTRYAVDIVECAGATGTLARPKFPPAADDVALEARTAGSLKVRIIPVRANSLVPNTSATALAVYRDQMMAMYPIDTLEMTVGGEISTAYPLNWSNLLDQVRSKRASDAPPGDVYYYGLVAPTATFRDFCSGSCTSGIAYVTRASSPSQRAGTGIGFADARSARVMAHELGHNHGRNHSPCGGTITGVDPEYPHAGGIIGVWGYDARTQSLFSPEQTTDVMGYCSNQWTSDYTYRGLFDRVVYLNANYSEYVAPSALDRWRVLLLDKDGPRWGLPIQEPSLPTGTAEIARVYDATGTEIGPITVYRNEIADIEAAMVMVPEPEPSWYAVEVTGWRPHPFAAPVTVPAP